MMGYAKKKKKSRKRCLRTWMVLTRAKMDGTCNKEAVQVGMC